MGEHDEHIAFEMGYNKGFKNGVKGSIPKADYENRLKADLVAMLTELKSNIDELASSYDVPNIYVEIGMKEIENEIQDLIQQKINFLSGL